MLTKVTLENYRCFRKAEVDLSPLTVFVGPNSSGKSSFIRALAPLHGGIRTADLRHGRADDFKIEQHFGDGGTATQVIKDGVQLGRPRHFGFQEIHLDLTRLRSSNQVAPAGQLEGTGFNLVNLFASISRTQQGQVSARFCELVPAFRDVDFLPAEGAPGFHRFRFQDRWNSEVWYPPEEVSDGTMLVLAYVLLQFQTQTLDLIAIEEPERGIHPYLLGELVTLWRRMSKGEIGPRPVQIVLATHSAELLDHLEPSEVRFFTRDDSDGSIRVEEAPADDQNWREAYKTYRDSLGSMWLSGGLGGVPGP